MKYDGVAFIYVEQNQSTFPLGLNKHILDKQIEQKSKNMVVYFCYHLSDNYVDLSYLYFDLSGIYVDLSDHYVDVSEKNHYN